MMPRQKIPHVLIPFVIVLIALGVGTAVFTAQSAGASPTGLPDIIITDAFPNLRFTRPVDIANAGDDRLFVVEQEGLIHILDETNNSTTDIFLDIRDRVERNIGNETGLLGLVFHPNYDSNGYFYVNYNRSEEIDGETILYTRIARFSVMSDTPNQADPASELVILEVIQPFTNHNAGDLAFGPDGFLYIPLGDGGSQGDPDDRAQKLTDLLGKFLRIDVDKQAGTAPDCGLNGDYTIPADNPFIGTPNACDEIWSLGFRNPWRFSFDAETGDMFIGDVGQFEWEEVSFQPASSSGGENYGWDIKEGDACFEPSSGCDDTGLTPPIYDYSHTATGGCSITGGFVYRGSRSLDLRGHYLFADLCLNQLWSLTESNGSWTRNNLATLPSNFIYTFGEDATGEIYFAANNAIYRIDTPQPFSRLSLEKSGPFVTNSVDPYSYTLSIESTGTQTTTNVILSDTLPVGTTYVGSNGGVLVGDVVTWEVGSLGVGETFTGTLSVQPIVTGFVRNEAYGVRGDEAIVVGGETAVLTLIADNNTHLPFIFK